jgi:benzoyl-CoA reductase/2-hydroxyglutaryl-CoA dehydratase subunit BcrC/BadD/HgdB
MNLPSIFKNNNETHDQNTIDFLIYELQRLKSFLEERLHVTISPQAILNSIKIYHQNARLLEKLSIFRQEGLLSVDEYYTLFKIGYFIRKEEHNTLISEALKALESRCYPDFNKKKKIKILVMGFINGDVNFIRFLKNFGMTIIADDLCGFSRYTTVKLLNKTIENPFTTIASSLLQRYCPLKISNENHFSRILSIYRNTGAQGIVILIYPFCDVQSINQAWLKHQLQEADIPVISLQPSLNIDNTAQLETRLEAFMEIVNG